MFFVTNLKSPFPLAQFSTYPRKEAIPVSEWNRTRLDRKHIQQSVWDIRRQGASLRGVVVCFHHNQNTRCPHMGSLSDAPTQNQSLLLIKKITSLVVHKILQQWNEILTRITRPYPERKKNTPNTSAWRTSPIQSHPLLLCLHLTRRDKISLVQALSVKNYNWTKKKVNSISPDTNEQNHANYLRFCLGVFADEA